MTFIPNVYGVLDSGNSTSTALTGNATFTGTSVDITDYNTINVSLYTDHNSADSGFWYSDS